MEINEIQGIIQDRKLSKPKVNSLKRSMQLTSQWLHRLRKRQKSQIDKIRNGRGDITVNFAEIKSIISEQDGQFYANKLDSLDEMEKFLEI